MQERLARRLQAGPADDAKACWLAVEAAGGRYLLPLAQAGEIFPYSPPHPVPYTRPWFLGVAHLRGGLWGAVDLAAFVAGEEAQAGGRGAASATEAGGVTASPGRGEAAGAAEVTERTEPTEEWRLVTFHAHLELNGALRVDRLAGLRGPDDFAARAPPPPGPPGWLADRYRDAQGQAWQALCLVSLAREPRFLSLAE